MTTIFSRLAPLALAMAIATCHSASKDCETSCANAISVLAKDPKDPRRAELGARCVPLCTESHYDVEVRRCLREAHTFFRVRTCMMVGNARSESGGSSGQPEPVAGGPDDEP